MITAKIQETAGAPEGTAQTQAENKISLLDGKLAFTLPGDMSDQSGKVGTQANNMHVYADSTGRKAVIIILSDDKPQGLGYTGEAAGRRAARPRSGFTSGHQ